MPNCCAMLMVPSAFAPNAVNVRPIMAARRVKRVDFFIGSEGFIIVVSLLIVIGSAIKKRRTTRYYFNKLFVVNNVLMKASYFLSVLLLKCFLE
ncbi:hypothetical protein Pcaca03_36790 [Pectobacterium carotovorum subsp. carotovorum]|uniref:Uncharacterized protein n=1 Tax=Pectobacterium carotovorum subsp. carotovorum TaxID=555 RepID=A0AAI9L4G9_PECCC|nr:hypothetical protein SOASR016_35490 [Pectobacterium carotovorum subsp. carotovorum]GLV71235.1 hypothetical protein Pcaca03_36790 [Pectobacterium carotovorum subsp. carotovorum]